MSYIVLKTEDLMATLCDTLWAVAVCSSHFCTTSLERIKIRRIETQWIEEIQRPADRDGPADLLRFCA